MEYLTFQLHGVMSAWGSPAIGEHRHADDRPTKSGVLGLVAGALGISRDQDDDHLMLQRCLGFASLTIRPGQLLIDFHTSQSPQKPQPWHKTGKDALSGDVKTALSQRDYQLNAYSVISLWERDVGSVQLAAIMDALQKPFYAPYLGRKTCVPALPFAPRITNAESLREALDNYPVPGAFSESKERLYAWEENAQAGMEPEHLSVERFDAIGSRKRWQHQPRNEYIRRDTEFRESRNVH